MDERIDRGLRDGLLAVLALGALVDALRRRNRLDALRSPSAAVAGGLGTVAVEMVMLRHPERTGALWERPSVRTASLLGTVLGGRSLVRRSGSRAVATLCWGLLAYLALLAFVLSGRANPLSELSLAEQQRTERLDGAQS